MEQTLQRDSAVSVPRQISGILMTRIRTGEYSPGSSLPSVRSLTREFSVSPVTIMRSLDILEDDGVVLRNRGKGVFVAPRIEDNSVPRIVFCFPPEKFEPETMGAECWALASEFYRGLLSGAAEERAEVSFLQLPYECSERDMARYGEQLDKFDVIIRHFDLLPALFAGIGKRKVVLTLGVDPAKCSDIDNVIAYDRNQAVETAVGYALKNGAKSAGALAFTEDVMNGKDRAQNFLDGCCSNGISVSQSDFVMFERSADWQQMLVQYVAAQTHLPDIIYCDDQKMIPGLYAAARSNALLPGKDFKVIAICTGATLINLDPAPAYVRIPRYEMGCGAVRIVLKALREKRGFTLPYFPAVLVGK